MKKIELVAGILSLIALLLNMLVIEDGVSEFMIIMFFLLGMTYMGLSFFIFNNTTIEQMSDPNRHKNTWRIIGSIQTGIVLSVIIIGILFTVKLWPSSDVMLTVGLTCIALIAIVGIIKYLQTKDMFYIIILKRVFIYGTFGLLFFFVPRSTWIKIKYRNHPAYIEALKKHMMHPDSRELGDTVRMERAKIYK